jgi:hypothetical protein
VFFPYQVLEDISPVWLWDYFLLGRLLIAGFFTYLFLKLLGLPFAPAFLGGVFYMFSGTFTWFINLEQFANNAMMVPVFLYCLERLVQKVNGKNLAISAIAFGLVLLAGQPEMAVYVLFLGVCYFAFHTFLRSKSRDIATNLIRFAAIFILGIGLAAPLILPFVEFMNYSHHIHPPGGDMGTRDPLSWEKAFNIITPTVHEYPQDPDYYTYRIPFASGKTPSGEPFYFRYFPTNGEWDYLGGYTGVLSGSLTLSGLFVILFKKSNNWRATHLFFFSFGLSIVLKNFGIKPFLWLGYLPLFDQAWSQRWAGPVWTFSFAVAGALGFQIIKEYLSDGIPRSLNRQDKTSDINSKNLLPFIEHVRRTVNIVFIKDVFIYVTSALISLILAYNSSKWWLRQMERIPITADLKLAIKAPFPWTILICVAVYLVVTFWKGKRIIRFSFKEYGLVFLLQVLLINLLFYNRGKEILIAQNLSLLYLLIIVFLWSIAGRFITTNLRRPTAEVTTANRRSSGFQIMLSEWIKKPYFSLLFAFLMVSGIYLCLSIATFKKYSYTEMSFLMKPYFGPSMIMGTGITVLVLIIATVISLYYIKTRKGLYGLIPLGILELWWAIPRGYSHDWLLIKLIPLVIGLFVVLTIALEKWRFVTVGMILFFISFAWLDFKSPNGFPDRYDPFTTAPYVDFLKNLDGHYRVMGGYGILYPNFASALGIQDIRYITALTPSMLDNYRRKYLHINEQGEFNSAVHWFTGKPEQYITSVDGEVMSYMPLENDFTENLKFYSLLGVKYVLLPSTLDLNRARYGRREDENLRFPLLYDKEIRVYENPYVLPRAFIAYEVEYAPTYREAQKTLLNDNFDLRYQVVLEEKAPQGYRGEIPKNPNAQAVIKEYRPNKVTIEVSTDHSGILVLSDTYDPGWKAFVDGQPEKIYRLDGIVRGIFLEKGSHRIFFSYLPQSFILGIVLSVVSSLICVVLFVRGSLPDKLFLFSMISRN